MLKIAVCDDDPEQLQQTAALLQSYLRAHPALEGQNTIFEDNRSLLEQAQAQKGFDLYVLDIIMPDLSGIETGRRLRSLGDGGEIVYLTSSNEFAADSYDVRAFFYLLKPVEDTKLFQVLDGAVEKLHRRRSNAVVVPTSEGPRRILLEHICYVERTGRIMRYYCVHGPVDSQTIRSSFKEMAAPLLADSRFCLCGASFVLNLQHVTGVNGQIALLDNGQAVSLPRTAAADFKRAWGNYWLQETPAW